MNTLSVRHGAKYIQTRRFLPELALFFTKSVLCRQLTSLFLLTTYRANILISDSFENIHTRNRTLVLRISNQSWNIFY